MRRKRIIVLVDQFSEEYRDEVAKALFEMIEEDDFSATLIGPFWVEGILNQRGWVASWHTNLSISHTVSTDKVYVVWDGISSKTAWWITECRKRNVPVSFEMVKVGDKFSIWYALGDADAICVTTNGFLTKNGRAVMGRGTALQAKVWFPDVEWVLGRCLKKEGNIPCILDKRDKTFLVSFPVKDKGGFWPCPVVEHAKQHLDGVRDGDFVPGYLLEASPAIIEKSANFLGSMIEAYGWKKVYLPWPGCGAGELSRDQVLSTLSKSQLVRVADRVHLVDLEGPVLFKSLL